MYDFNTLLQRRGTDCTKWDALDRDFGRADLMPFWVADTDFPVFENVREAIIKRAGEGQTFGYTFAGEQYFDSVIQWNRVRHNLILKKEEILPVPGVVTALAVILMAMSQPGDKVLINPPVYTPFFSTVTDLERELVCSSLVQKEGRYEIDFDDLEQKLASGVKLYIFCSPHNPVGRVWEEEELKKIGSLCRKYKVQLISDEIHYDIVFSGHQHLPVLNVVPEAVLITAPSKTFNIAGLKSSVIFARDPAVRGKIEKWISQMHLYPNLFAFQATIAAYQTGEPWVDEMNAYLEKNALFTVEFLKNNLPGVKAYVPESTYLMWLDFSGLGISGEEINRRLVEEAGVALNPGEEYGEEYSRFVRLNIAVPKAYLQQGLERMVSVF